MVNGVPGKGSAMVLLTMISVVLNKDYVIFTGHESLMKMALMINCAHQRKLNLLFSNLADKLTAKMYSNPSKSRNYGLVRKID